jgi:hypothetical protein
MQGAQKESGGHLGRARTTTVNPRSRVAGYGPRVMFHQLPAGRREPGPRSRSGPLDGLSIALLGMALAVAACGQTSPSSPPAAVTPAPTSPAAAASASVAPSSVALTPTATPTVAPLAAVRVRVAHSAIGLPSARSRAVALAFGSTILLCGGLTSTGTTTGSILRIDLGSGRVSEAGTLAAPVHDAGGAVLGGSGFVFGGGQVGPGSIVQRVGPSGGAITVGQLPAVRADLVAVSVTGSSSSSAVARRPAPTLGSSPRPTAATSGSWRRFLSASDIRRSRSSEASCMSSAGARHRATHG